MCVCIYIYICVCVYIYIQHFIPSLARYSCSLFLDIDMDINIILSSLMEHGKAI